MNIRTRDSHYAWTKIWGAGSEGGKDVRLLPPLQPSWDTVRGSPLSRVAVYPPGRVDGTGGMDMVVHTTATLGDGSGSMISSSGNETFTPSRLKTTGMISFDTPAS